MESIILFLHIAAGSMAILAGAVAIYAAKGASLHRRSGIFFVYAMIIMGMSGMLIAITRGIAGSILGGPIAAYLVITSLTTVRPISRKLDVAMILVALAISVTCTALVVDSYTNGNGTIDGVPAPMLILFGTIAFFSGLSDVRLLRNGALQGSRRIARHLWRMCFAFWVATGSFFLGQIDEFPVWLQNAALLSIPAFFPLAAMVYWLWRVRYRRLMSGITLRQAAATSIGG